NNPKYSMIVVIQNPRNGYYAATVAGPVFNEIAQRVYANDISMYQSYNSFKSVSNNVDPEIKKGSMDATNRLYAEFGVKNSVNKTDAISASYENKESEIGRVPDLIGMGLRDALYILGNAGFKVSVNGKGKVVNQSLEAGQQLAKNLFISIDLK